MWSKGEIDLEVCRPKSSERCNCFLGGPICRDFGISIGTSLVTQSSSLIEETPPLIYFNKTLVRPRAICFRLK